MIPKKPQKPSSTPEKRLDLFLPAGSATLMAGLLLIIFIFLDFRAENYHLSV